GTERLHLALDDYPDIADSLPNRDDILPFRFDADDLVEVIGALADFTNSESVSQFDSARDFEAIKIKDQKNKANGLTPHYFQEIIVNGSMPYFANVEAFLKNPRNQRFATLYHDAADELKQKILINRSKFDAFDNVFAFLYEAVQAQRTA